MSSEWQREGTRPGVKMRSRMRPQPCEIQLGERQTYDLPSASVASAAIALSLKRFHSPALGYVGSTLRASGGRYTLPEPCRSVVYAYRLVSGERGPGPGRRLELEQHA